jgi:tetratricopeptide (TPR) repeat protein
LFKIEMHNIPNDDQTRFPARQTLKRTDMTQRFIALLCFVLLLLDSATSHAESWLVRDGRAQADIIIAEEPTRTQRLAARELQTYVEKISGATLRIATIPSADMPLHVYVGESAHTRKLGITDDGLTDGAYRIVSGENWLVLIGDDSNFTPIEPWPRSNTDIASGKMQAAWDQITGKQWGYMHSQLHKHYSGPNSLFGTDQEQITDKDGNVNVWTYDERGSFNAVCGFLRSLGVRWYMPGEIGEIVPKSTSIELPQIDQTVRPDFPMRILNFRAAVYGRDVMMWGFRLGVRQPYGRQAAHGLHGMTDNERTLTSYPDWFALYGGKRHNQLNVGNNQLCYSNEELFREAVEFARVQLDHFRMDVVSIMPPDGYTALCQCEKCQGKESPELGSRGMASNYVWDFVNRVAKEVRRTHPDKKISNCAYGIYTEPPSNIDKLEPNIQVIIVGGRRPTAEDRDDLRRLRAEWQKKTDNPLEIFENYPFTGRGFYLPAYMPRTLGESINETKGQSRGEDIWFTMDFRENAVGYNHFLAYFTARMYWGGKDQDASALFDEYVQKFYGPAAPGMAEFFSYCEQNWRDMEQDGDKADRAIALFAAAKSSANADSVYGRRLQLIDNYLNGLRSKARQLAQKRGPVPKLRLVSGVEQRGKIVVDGKLDDGPWVNIPASSIGYLRELQTGTLPTFGTRFMAEWIGNDLYFAIRCDELVGDKPNIAATKDGDQAIWYGDVVEIELATDAHSYYQLAISPSGALVDLDRGAPRNQWFNWSSKAEVATHIAADHWTIEVRIPVTQDDNDPLHQVIGHKPTESLPWHINVCRQRTRDNGTELSAFSPTGTSGFHEPMKFAHFHAGRSHQFEADATVTDYLIESRAAETLERARNWQTALTAYQTLTRRETLTDLQRSRAYQRSAHCAVNLEDFDQAGKLADQIPIESVAATTRMQVLAAQRQWAEITTDFGDEDLTEWPFWQIAEGAFARGRAFYFTKDAKRADADLQLALKYESHPQIQVIVRTLMAQNREANLNDDSGALELYRQNFAGKTGIGGADEFRSVDRAATILAKQQRFDAAIATFDVVNFEQQRGFWLHEMLLSKGHVLSAAGRVDEAGTLFRRVADDDTASDAHRKRAREALGQ